MVFVTFSWFSYWPVLSQLFDMTHVLVFSVLERHHSWTSMWTRSSATSTRRPLEQISSQKKSWWMTGLSQCRYWHHQTLCPSITSTAYLKIFDNWKVAFRNSRMFCLVAAQVAKTDECYSVGGHVDLPLSRCLLSEVYVAHNSKSKHDSTMWLNNKILGSMWTCVPAHLGTLMPKITGSLKVTLGLSLGPA